MGTSGGGEEQYHLKWNDYNNSLTKCFRDLRDNEEMLDVTLVSDGHTFKAHKLVLSACSPIFKSMLKKTRGPYVQPLIFLHNVRREDIEAILDFMYNGEVSVSQHDLRSFLGVAEDLRVRGLTQMDVEPNKNKTETSNDEISNRKRRNSHDEDLIEPKRYLATNNEEPEIQEPEFVGDSSPYHTPQAYYPRSSIDTNIPGASTSLDSPGSIPAGQVSYHRLGGRDADDPLTNVVVTHSSKGWHCPDCVHIATTKGNLKSHIMSGRHKVHQSEKQFKCRFCERSYLTRQSLQVHISTNHRNERNMESQHENLNCSAGNNFLYEVNSANIKPNLNEQEIYSDSNHENSQ